MEISQHNELRWSRYQRFDIKHGNKHRLSIREEYCHEQQISVIFIDHEIKYWVE